MIWPFGSLFEAFLALVSFLVLFIVYRYFIAVYLEMRYYAKQGAVMIFHKRLSPRFQNYKDAIDKDDYFYMYREIAKKHPKAHCLVENFGGSIILIPINVEMIKEYLQRYEDYHRSKDMIGLIAVLENGTIVLEEGNHWKKQRKHMSAAFQYDYIKGVTPMMVQVAKERFDIWIKNGELEHFDVAKQMGKITGESVGRFFFGQRFSEEKIWGVSWTTATQDFVTTLGKENATIFSAIFGPNFAKMGILPRHREMIRKIKEYRARCQALIEEIEKNGSKEENFLKTLLERRRTGPREEDDVYLKDEKIIGSFIGLFVAGTDDTSLTLNSILYNLSQYPEAFKKLIEEIDTKVNSFDDLTTDTLNNLNYTTAVIKESLRLKSVTGGFFPRIAVKDSELNGIKVKKGTIVDACMQVPHYSEEYFTRGDEFIPERWLEDQKEFKADDQAFLSFSSGSRNCIGRHFGMAQLRILIAMLVKTFDMDFPKDYKMVQIRAAILTPIKPFIIKMKLKSSQ